ncbi:MAG: YbfB/YjiJ family MFS transporter [Ectothiorhodospiraceae bacterium]|nr:YbfB/YjiJ family MFS transporter [Ectothiorhodospiraceae bacterium]
MQLYRVLAGAVAILVGLGMARFGYPPLVPGMVEQGWFTPAQAGYLGAANLLGYLFGALSASRFATRVGTAASIRLGLALITLSFLVSSWAAPFLWFFLWRFLSGWAGGILMVVAASTVLTTTPLKQRPLAGAIVFSGAGVGVLFSANVVPWLTALSVSWAWLAMGLLCLGLMLATWRAWEAEAAAGKASTAQLLAPVGALPLAVLLVVVGYGLQSVGYVPHTLFWVDFLAREQGLGAAFASVQWSLFALGAIAGPFLAGWVAARLGWYPALLLAVALMTVALLLSSVADTLLLASLCSFVVGAMVPGLVSLTSGYLSQLVPLEEHRRAWGWATASFALAQAVGGYALAGVFGWVGSYPPVFIIGGVSLFLGFIVAALSRFGRSPA